MKKIAILNTDESMMELLRELLTENGEYDVVTAEITNLKRCENSVIEFFAKEKPEIVIFDIPPPYVENWNYLKLLKKAYPLIKFIAMTTSKKELEHRVGEIPGLIDLMCKPFLATQMLEKLRATT